MMKTLARPKAAKLSAAFVAVIMTAACEPANEPANQIEEEMPESLLYVWMYDAEKKNPDFLAVIDADTGSAEYGEIITTVPTDNIRGHAHHTNITLPYSGMLFANDFMGNYTYIFDTNDPAKPVLSASFGNIAGYSFPHSFSELPNGNMLVTFQTKGDGNDTPGGLLELTTSGELVQVGDAEIGDPDIFVRPYGIVLLPDVDRAVTTSFDMRGAGLGEHVQVWRLSDLTLLHTVQVPAVDGDFHINPFEARLLADGSTVMIQSLACGLFTLTGVDGDAPVVRHVGDFEGEYCGVPVRVENYWVQTAMSEAAGAPNRLISLDVSDPLNPIEVDRLEFADGFGPHWVSPDRTGRRIVVNGYGAELSRRVMLVSFDPDSGSLEFDQNFGAGDAAGPGLIIDRESWPHGDVGPARAHGAVFWPSADPDWKN